MAGRGRSGPRSRRAQTRGGFSNCRRSRVYFWRPCWQKHNTGRTRLHRDLTENRGTFGKLTERKPTFGKGTKRGMYPSHLGRGKNPRQKIVPWLRGSVRATLTNQNLK